MIIRNMFDAIYQEVHNQQSVSSHAEANLAIYVSHAGWREIMRDQYGDFSATLYQEISEKREILGFKIYRVTDDHPDFRVVAL